jgi:hypothetical protein
MVVSHVKNPKDLLSLCLVSRNLYNVSWVMLYKSVSTRLDLSGRRFPGMATLSVSSHVKLFQTLQIPRIAGLITDFRTHIAFCACSLPGGKAQKTNCNAFDSLLGRVLEALENLQVLHFTCRCCYSRSSASRHEYLANLKTRQLHELQFYCGCKLESETRKSDFLASPCMQAVTSLAIFNGIDASNLAVLEGNDSLPQLKKLLCNDRRILDSLLRKGTVTHLMLDQPGWDAERLLDSLGQHSRSLTHFNIANSDCYPAFLSTSIDIFSRLQYIGRLHFNMTTVRTSSHTKCRISCLSSSHQPTGTTLYDGYAASQRYPQFRFGWTIFVDALILLFTYSIIPAMETWSVI